MNTIMAILKQNTEGVNKAWAKTPYGKMIKAQNKYKKELAKLAPESLKMKTAMLELNTAMLPFYNTLIHRIVIPITTLISKFTKANETFRKAHPVLSELIDIFTSVAVTMAGLRIALVLFNGTLLKTIGRIALASIPFLLWAGAITIVLLVLEDLWGYFTGKRGSLTELVVKSFKGFYKESFKLRRAMILITGSAKALWGALTLDPKMVGDAISTATAQLKQLRKEENEFHNKQKLANGQTQGQVILGKAPQPTNPFGDNGIGVSTTKNTKTTTNVTNINIDGIHLKKGDKGYKDLHDSVLYVTEKKKGGK